MDPKVAVVCGAHTELGKLVIRELLRHERIERVYALAEKDPRDDISIRPSELSKMVLHIDSFDHIEHLIATHIPHVDLAFCCLGCGKSQLSSLGAFTFHRLNLDIPQRFVHEMFRLGTQHISILSHVAAASHRRPTQFHRVKGELADKVKQLHRDAGPYAPAVSLFNVPILLTNMKDQNGIIEQETSKVDKIFQIAALKFDLTPAHAVHVRDVAKAMVADAFERLEFEDDTTDLTDVLKKTTVRIAELDGPMIVYLAKTTRAIQKNTNWKKFDRTTVQRKVSTYAIQQGAFQNIQQLSENPHSFQSYQNHSNDLNHDQITNHPANTNHNNSNPSSPNPNDLSFEEDSLESSGIERYRSLSYTHTIANTETRNQQQSNLDPMPGNTIPSPSLSPSLPPTPAPTPATPSYYRSQTSSNPPSVKSPRSKSMSRSKSAGSIHSSKNQQTSKSPTSSTRLLQQVFQSPSRKSNSSRRPRANGYDMTTNVGGSAAALGEQVERNLINVHGNNILPDVRHPSRVPSTKYTPSHRSASLQRQQQYLLQGPNHNGSPPRIEYGLNYIHGLNGRGIRSAHNSTNSLSSPPSGSIERAAYDVPLSPPRPPEKRSNKPSLINIRHSMGSSSARKESLGRSSRRSSIRTRSDSRRSFQNSDGRSSGRASQPGNVVSHLSALAGKVIAVTERPSTRRQREALEAQRLRAMRKEPPIKTNGDMRAMGETTI